MKSKEDKFILAFVMLTILFAISIWYIFALRSDLNTANTLNKVSKQFFYEQLDKQKEKNKLDSINLSTEYDLIIGKLKSKIYLRGQNINNLKNEIAKLSNYKTDSVYKSINDSILEISMRHK